MLGSNATHFVVDDAKMTRIKATERRSASKSSAEASGQQRELCGVLILVGGTGDPVAVHLQDGDAVHVCEATRSLAREMAAHLFGAPLRVAGTGQSTDGSFRIQDFRTDDGPTDAAAGLGEAYEEWLRRQNPARELIYRRFGP
jgi:hypothetical protein